MASKLLKGAKGIAKAFGLTPRAVYHMIEDHNMPVIRIGSSIYGREETISKWFAEKEISNG